MPGVRNRTKSLDYSIYLNTGSLTYLPLDYSGFSEKNEIEVE
jgi:hypothetical protein